MSSTYLTERRFDDAAQDVAQAARWLRKGVRREDPVAMAIAEEWLETALAKWEQARDEHSRALEEAAARRGATP